MTHRIAVTNSELNIIRYALEQHIMTINNLLKEGKAVIADEYQETFSRYIKDMQNVLDDVLPEA
jgi:hypothetical protein